MGNRPWSVGWATLCGLLLVACGGRVEGTDSSTHWLDRCDEDRDCSFGLKCECGSCTKTCDEVQDCKGLTGAVCAEAQCGDGTVAACTTTCNRDADCGTGTCFEGACTLALQCEGTTCSASQDASAPQESTVDASFVDSETASTASSPDDEQAFDASLPDDDASTRAPESTTLVQSTVALQPASTGEQTTAPSTTQPVTANASSSTSSLAQPSSNDATSSAPVSSAATQDVCSGVGCDEETTASNASESSTDSASAETEIFTSETGDNGCPAMDVANATNECAGTLVSYWNGNECVSEQWCECVGADCDALFTYHDDCRSHYAACIDEVPTCTDEISLAENDSGLVVPTDAGLSFSVVGEEPGQYEEAPASAPLGDFTLAEWRGNEASDAGGDLSTILTFLVEGVKHEFWLDFGNSDWPLYNLDGVEVGDAVQLRVVRSGGEPVELQVRDMSEVPILWFVQSAGIELQSRWAFGDLNAKVGAPICKRIGQPCNWLFTLDELVVSFGELERTLQQMQGTHIGEGAPGYEVMTGYLFSNNRPAFDGESCAAGFPRYDGFVVWRNDDPEDE